jgi:hypothetical protein
MTNLDQVLAQISVAKTRFAPRIRKMNEVLAIREGRWDEVAPGSSRRRSPSR